MTESLNAALVECVKACGGSAMVGAKLWPEKEPHAAQRALLDCLNEDRPARLTPEQVLLILRLSRERGCHTGMNYLAEVLSYAEPVPIKPSDAADQLRRQAIEMGRALQETLQRLEQIERPSLRSAA